MTDPFDNTDSFAEKLEVLVQNHRKFVEEFERSLTNSAHFLALADRSMEQEPESTVSMLQQVLEVDLLGNLQNLAEELGAVRDHVEASPLSMDLDDHKVALAEIAARYEALEERAAEQVGQMETILRALDV